MGKDFFEDVVECLKRSGSHTTIAPAILQEFLQSSVAPANVSAASLRPVSAVPAAARPARPPVSAPPPAGKTAAVSAVPDELRNAASLDELVRIAFACQGCPLSQFRHNVVFGEGNPHAKLMFIGEGPGHDEDEQGRPFVGKAGQLLDKMIAAMTLKREDVFIANIVKCRPPENRVPVPAEAAACLPFLRRQIELVSPRVIVTLGKTPLLYLLNCNAPITRVRGHWMKYGEIPVMPTFHPAYLLRQESAKRDVWNDLKAVMQYMGLSLPVRPRA